MACLKLVPFHIVLVCVVLLLFYITHYSLQLNRTFEHHKIFVAVVNGKSLILIIVISIIIIVLTFYCDPQSCLCIGLIVIGNGCGIVCEFTTVSLNQTIPTVVFHDEIEQEKPALVDLLNSCC